MKRKTIQMDDGAQLKVWDSEGYGTPIIFIHGFPENHYCWDSVLQNLKPSIKKKCRFIVYDLRGFGESDKSGEASLIRFYKDHESLVAQLNLRRYHVVGHDWGGAIALHIARFNPNSIKTLAVLNTNYWKTDLRGMWHLFFLNLPFVPKLTFKLIPDLFFKFILHVSFIDSQKISKKTQQSYLAMFRDQKTISYWMRLYKNMAKTLIDLSIPFKKKIQQKQNKNAYKVPITLIWGKEDRYNPVWIGKNIEENLKKRGADVALHLIPGAGHFVQEEKPEEVSKYLINHWKI